MNQEANIPQVQRVLPAGGLDELLMRPWGSLLNVLMASHYQAIGPVAGRFPLQLMIMAPNTRDFLASLGKPIGIAQELEARPGVWWLATADGQHEYLITSDSHRVNSWKGGQVCIASTLSSPMTVDHPAVQALQRGFEQVWGLPGLHPQETTRSIIEDLVWFGERSTPAAPIAWPVAAAPPTMSPRLRSS